MHKLLSKNLFKAPKIFHIVKRLERGVTKRFLFNLLTAI
jgi:hypothetical protein